jgi:hypothetical protein
MKEVKKDLGYYIINYGILLVGAIALFLALR